MKDFITYLNKYLRRLTLTSMLSTIIFISILIICNYTFGIERRIRDIRPWYLSLSSFFFFYSFVFYFAWGLTGIPAIRPPADRRHFLLILMAAPLYFSFKMIHWDLSPLLPDGLHYPWDRYALIVLQLPAKLLLLCVLLWCCDKLLRQENISGSAVFGLTTRNFRAAPYFILLTLMLPLVALASTRPDFLHTYPKVKNVAFITGYTSHSWPWQLLYELSYGLDFFSIELFFRGLLVIGLAHYAGEKAILPMAAFYCTIHFGKPLGECISSFFGGLILGVIALRTRSILGGLIVHLGLAWLMELGGWLGNLFSL
ncbi:MAG: CPBP family intramembrane metalloprotease [Chitinophagaceae bacterium]|nr:CPBP family intramembrane metalloprotease [Chitinophagaceae bacterium]